jgi:hypothetical protein
VLLRERVKRIRAREHLERIEPALAGQSASVFLAEKRLGAEPYALIGHELRGFFVHEMAVFDTLNADRQRATDRDRRIGVEGDIRIPVSGGFDAGSHLEFAKRQHVERRARRRDPAAADELDLGGPLQELLAHPQPHLVRAVGDIRGAFLLEKAERPAGTAR